MKWTKMEAVESRKKETTLLKKASMVNRDDGQIYPLRDCTYTYKCETTLSTQEGHEVGRVERWYFRGDSLHHAASVYRWWAYTDCGIYTELTYRKLWWCKSHVEKLVGDIG